MQQLTVDNRLIMQRIDRWCFLGGWRHLEDVVGAAEHLYRLLLLVIVDVNGCTVGDDTLLLVFAPKQTQTVAI